MDTWDAEDVRFTDAKIGVSTKADVMTLSSTSVAVSVDLDVSSDATVNGTLGVVNDLSVGDASRHARLQLTRVMGRWRSEPPGSSRWTGQLETP